MLKIDGQYRSQRVRDGGPFRSLAVDCLPGRFRWLGVLEKLGKSHVLLVTIRVQYLKQRFRGVIGHHRAWKPASIKFFPYGVADVGGGFVCGEYLRRDGSDSSKV
jgi:hypothetical protein